MVRACGEAYHEPEAVLSHVNRLFWTMSPGDLSAALICALLPTNSGKVRLAAGGHAGVMLLSGESRWRDRSRAGLRLGTDWDTRYLAEEIVLKHDEALLLISPTIMQGPSNGSSAQHLRGLAEFLSSEAKGNGTSWSPPRRGILLAWPRQPAAFAAP